jgi:hypothetical protein
VSEGITIELTFEARHILEHATGFRSKSPGYRNHFCAAPDNDHWPALQALCERGLMRMVPNNVPLGGMETFSVTDAGKVLLGRPPTSKESSDV